MPKHNYLLRIESGTWSRWQDAAITDRRSVKSLIEIAVEQYLADLEQDQALDNALNESKLSLQGD